MSISLDLSDDQARRLEDSARGLGMDPSELAKAVINDFISRPAQDFEPAAKLVIEKTTNFTGGSADAIPDAP